MKSSCCQLRALSLLLMLFASASLFAQESSFTVEFGTNSKEPSTKLTATTLYNFIQSGQEYVYSASNVSNCYQGKYGLRLYKKSLLGFACDGGSFVLNFDGVYNVTRIEFTYNQPKGNNRFDVEVNGNEYCTELFGRSVLLIAANSVSGIATANIGGQPTSSIKVTQDMGSGAVLASGYGSYIKKIEVFYTE